MKVHDTVKGWLMTVPLVVGVTFSYALNGNRWAAEPVVPWQLYWACLIAVMVHSFLLDRRGVFDHDDGAVVVRRLVRRVVIPGQEQPTVAFAKRWLGYRLVVDTNTMGGVETDFWFFKPAISTWSEHPENLHNPSAARESTK